MADELRVTAIYVLPSEPNIPPRAIIGSPVATEAGEGVIGIQSTWSADLGMWTIEGAPVGNELSDAITEHAKSLGVEW